MNDSVHLLRRAATHRALTQAGSQVVARWRRLAGHERAPHRLGEELVLHLAAAIGGGGEATAPEALLALLAQAYPEPADVAGALRALGDAVSEVLEELERPLGPAERERVRATLAQLEAESATRAAAAARARVAALEEERALHQGFLRLLCHELRTPISAASLCLQLLDRSSDPVARARAVDAARRSLRQLDTIALNLVDVNRILSGRPITLQLEPFDLAVYLRELVGDLESERWRERCRVEAPPEVPGWWSRDALRRLLRALVDNAFRYGAWDTVVTLRLTTSGERVRIEVHNEGAPIPPEQQAAVLSGRSAQVTGQTGALAPGALGAAGLGVGLVLARGLAAAHGGEVTLRSGPVEGTTFALDLPRDARAAQARHRASGRSAPSG